MEELSAYTAVYQGVSKAAKIDATETSELDLGHPSRRSVVPRQLPGRPPQLSNNKHPLGGSFEIGSDILLVTGIY